VINSKISTGDDCVSLGDGSQDILIQGVNCGPGHGISIGSLGKYQNEQPVSGVKVIGCTLTNTETGVRIKTWPDSYPGSASDIHFENIIMENVDTPILIDQEYCPWNQCKSQVPTTSH
jgi:galacturan 1,4-alpha-galacturonidase